MKKYLHILLTGCLLAMIGSSCSKEQIFDGEGDDDANAVTAEVSFRNMILTIDGEEKIKHVIAPDGTTRATADVSTFTVDLWKDGVKKKSYLYAEMPEVLTLPVGDYTVKVSSGELKTAEFETPFFYGEQDFTVAAGTINEVDPVVCKFSNVRVTIIFDEALRQHMTPESKVNVKVGDNYQLDFVRDESRSGYFAYLENSKTLVATFSGVVDGSGFETFKSYTDVAPGNHYKITYRYHDADMPQGSGSISQGINVDATIEVETISLNVDVPTDELLKDDDRPVNGDEESDDPVDPEVPQSVTIEPADGCNIVLNNGYIALADNAAKNAKINVVYEGSTVKVEINCANGVKAFDVVIDSAKLNADELQNVGLQANLDLVNEPPVPEGENENYWAKLDRLGLPTNVGGKTYVSFDISGFIGLLNLLGEGTHNFIMTVQDTDGTTVTKTLILNNKSN